MITTDTASDRALADLFRRWCALRGDDPDGDVNGGDLVEAVTEMFASLGLDVQGPSSQVDSPIRPAHVLFRDAIVTVADADPEDGTPSDVYELRVHGVSVLVRLRDTWAGERNVPYVHIEHEAPRPRLLLVEVDNAGEREHR